MFRQRYLFPFMQTDLGTRKMVFIGGPRQVGKTTLSQSLIGPGTNETHEAYLNWDDPASRKLFLRGQLPGQFPCYVLDEIHKFKNWRAMVKGFYDKRKSVTQFIVTGSARLDYYRKGGDSLLGRYHYYRLHPYSLGEADSKFQPETLHKLLEFGGFPEPFFHGDSTFTRRWQKERVSRIVDEDVRDLENIKELSLIELLADALPSRVGAPLSIKNLREDLASSHEAVERWVTILERMYYAFRIPPFGSPKIRAVKKEQKLYLWDWSEVEEPSFRFENLVASQLLKWCHFMDDTQGHRMELRFIRDTDKREIDFVVIKDKKPVFAVECKTGEKVASSAAHYFRARTSIPKFYQVHLGTADFGNADTDVRVLPFTTFCRDLRMP